jgi:hypothetical protein
VTTLPTDILTTLATLAQGVSGIGQVHSSQRFSGHWDAYLDLFKTTVAGTPQVRGLMLTFDEHQPIQGTEDAFGKVAWTFNVVGYLLMSVRDSDTSEHTFFNLLHDLLRVFAAQSNLGLEASGVRRFGIGTPGVRLAQIRTFGPELCHYAELTLAVQVVEAVSYA